MFQPHVLLYPTDYSDSARYAYDVAVDLARHYSARLLILHVADTLGAESVSFGEATSERQPAGHHRRLLEELEREAPRPGDGVGVEYLLAAGDPSTIIAQTVTERHCDLIVMGTHGRSALSRLFSGSVTQWVSRHVPCAVLTVRMPAGVTAAVG